MSTTPPANDLKTYRDGDRYIIGRASWQTCMSMTYGVADAYGRREARALIAEYSAMSAAAIDALKRSYETPYRFETACDDGHFGAAW